ncbi:MAG: hypothetical protein JSS66_04695 [Armatimonadetes bacterium]|nr:hypothetical protein [Armatimonadota bacterium]
MNKQTVKPQIAVVRPISEACQCPFYAQNAKGHGFCFIKNALSLDAAQGLVDNPSELEESDWASDCSGLWDNCTVLPLLYEYSEADIDPNAYDEADDYAPFDEEEDSEEEDESAPRTLDSFTPPEVAARAAAERAAVEQEEYSADPLAYASAAEFSIHQVPDPYRVKCDAILLPVNNLLEPVDLMLTRHCGAYMDSARQKHKGSVSMGHVYPVKSPHPAIAAKKWVYRGVVAGVQTVNAVDIEEAVRRSLHLADASGVEVLAMVPMDYAGFDVELTAQAQISTVHEFLVSTPTTSLRHIVVLIPDDVTVEIFDEYYERIFAD